MDTRRPFWIFLSCLLNCPFSANGQQATVPTNSWRVYFSPHGSATSAICQALNNTKSTVLVQAYSFTSATIAEALVKAHRRGVKVQVILDRSQKTQKYSSADFLVNSGIPTRIDAAHAIAHNKIIVIDDEVVITGSFNFIKSSRRKERREPSCFPRQGTCCPIYRKLAFSPGSFRTVQSD